MGKGFNNMANWFIYELHYFNTPFYVGYSQCPETRYLSHLHDPLSKCRPFIRFCIKYYNAYPDLNIIDIAYNRADILDKERLQISKRLKEGYELLNFRKISIDPIVLPKWKLIPIHIFETSKNQQAALLK